MSIRTRREDKDKSSGKWARMVIELIIIYDPHKSKCRKPI